MSVEPDAWIHYFKFDGSEHWRIEAELRREDDNGWWLRGHPGYRVTRAGDVAVVEKVGFVALVPRDAWWAAFWNFDRNGDYELYVDVATPATWRDGELQLVDLDLDVVRDWEGTVHLLDEDEFAEHSVKYSYPDHVKDAALASAERLVGAISNREPPFDLVDAERHWA